MTPKRIRDDVARELGRFGVPAALGEIVTAWPGVVGDDIARHAWPGRIGRDGTLEVTTESSIWAFELSQLASDLLDRLQRVVGDAAPKALRFVVGAVPAPAAELPGEDRHVAAQPSAEDRKSAASLAGGIDDEELRELVARAVAASLARSASDR